MGLRTPAKKERSDRRVWIRYPCDLEALCQSPDDDSESVRLAARVRDISRGGCSLAVNSEFEPGRLLSVELPGGPDCPPSMVLAYVVRVATTSRGEWALGCSFAEELDDADLRPFGATAVKAEPDDQRTWVRVPCSARAVYQQVRAADPHTAPAQVLDISPAGIGLLVDSTVTLGTLLSLELQDATRRNRLSILGSVVRVTPRGAGEFVWGCSFIRELTAEELSALLEVAPPATV